MTAPTQLEERLRTGLRAAAEAVPPAPDTIPVPDEQVVRLRSVGLAPGVGSRRRRAMVALATAAALAALAGTAVVLTGDDGDDADRTADIADADDPTTTTAAPYTPRDVNGAVPGRAIATGSVLHTFGPDGQPTGTVDLAPLENIMAATSDLNGGWVACGFAGYRTFEELNPDLSPEELAELEDELDQVREAARAADDQASPTTPPSTAPSTVPTTVPGSPDDTVPVLETTGEMTGGWPDVLVWFPAGRDPVELDGNLGMAGCGLGGPKVVDSPDGPVALLGGVSLGTGSGMTPRMEGIVLATGERRDYRTPDLAGLPMHWSVTTGKALTWVEGVGLQLFDLDTAEELPIADIDPGSWIGGLALSHDGKTAAVLVGQAAGPDEAIVYDLATGAVIFRRTFDMPTEGDELSYDGTTLAVGNFYDGNGAVTVIDVATGAEHTIEGHGVIL